MEERTKDSIKNNLGYLIIALVCLVYISTAFITVDRTGKGIFEIIADGMIAFMFGFCMNKVFELQGMKNGEKEEKTVSTTRLHSECVMKIAPFIDKLDGWCELKNSDNLRIQRTRILAKAGLKYSSCFDSDGVALRYIPNENFMNDKKLKKIEEKREKAYYKAVNIELTLLSPSDLTSNGYRQDDPFNFGRNKIEYERQMSKREIIMKIFTACLFGYYGVRLIENFNYAALIWTSLQVGLFLITGVTKMYQAYYYITDEYRSGIIRKIDLIQKFENYIESFIPTVNQIESEEISNVIHRLRSENHKREISEHCGNNCSDCKEDGNKHSGQQYNSRSETY